MVVEIGLPGIEPEQAWLDVTERVVRAKGVAQLGDGIHTGPVLKRERITGTAQPRIALVSVPNRPVPASISSRKSALGLDLPSATFAPPGGKPLIDLSNYSRTKKSFAKSLIVCTVMRSECEAPHKGISGC
nr:hypothetical protein [Nitrosomonas nitrosa]